MVCDFHIQPPFFVLNCLQIRIKELSPSSLTTTSANFHSPQMSQPHMLYFSRCAFPLKYSILRKCLHLQFTTYHILCIWMVCKCVSTCFFCYHIITFCAFNIRQCCLIFHIAIAHIFISCTGITINSY